MLNCHICDIDIEESRYRPEVPPLCSKECYSDWLWQERYAKASNSNIAIVGGYWYTIGEQPPAGGKFFFQGYGGHKFVFKFFDDKRGTVTSTNVWGGGRIPPKHRDVLKDNAVIVIDLKYS